MSNRAKARKVVRLGKYWEPEASPFVVEPVTQVSLVAAPPLRVDPLRSLPDEQRDLALRVLRLLDLWMVVWDGYEPTSPRGWGAYEIASRLSIGSYSHVLSGVLSTMQKLGLLKYEFDRGVDREVRWWITEAGVALVAPS